MRFILHCSLSLLLFTLAIPMEASTVRVIASKDKIVHQQGDPTSPSITLQLENTVLGEMPEVLIWQLGIDIVPSATAVGSIGFAEAAKPTDYLFSGFSSPLSIPSLPQPMPPASLNVSDSLIFAPNGIPLLALNPRNVVTLVLSLSDDAEGLFNLVLVPFGGDIFGGSSWAPQLVFNPMDASEFENAEMGSSFDSRTVASILVVAVPEPCCSVLFGMGFVGWMVARRDPKRRTSSVAT